MNLRVLSFVAVSALTLVIPGCGDLRPDRIANCRVSYINGGWNDDPYRVDPSIKSEYDDGMCPIAILYPEEAVYAAGYVTSRNVFNGDGTMNQSESAVLQIENANRFVVRNRRQPFRIVNIDYKEAEVAVGYNAISAHHTFTEKDLFSLRIEDLCCSFPQFRAQIDLDLDYITDTQARVRVAGNEVPTGNSIETWEAASKSAGRPHAYRWYRDGVYVDSGAAYTSSAGTADFTLRVEMTDTYGRTASDSFRVDVDGVRTTISGPETVYANDSPGTWNAIVFGGYGPYTYRWTVNGQLVGTGESWTGLRPSAGWFQLRLDVRDAHGTTRSATVDVTQVGDAPGGCQTGPPMQCPADGI